MFGKKKIYTIVVHDAGNVYIQGRVSGMIYVLAGKLEKRGFANVVHAGVTTMKVETTERRYKKMRKFLEFSYPGMCQFYYC